MPTLPAPRGPSAPPGRPTKRTPQTQQRIIHALLLGATLRHAAEAGGVSVSTLAEWRKGDAAFARAIEQAEADAALRCLQQLGKAAQDGDWHAAAWLLERRYPHEYGRQAQEQQHSGEVRIVIERVGDWRSRSTDA